MTEYILLIYVIGCVISFSLLIKLGNGQGYLTIRDVFWIFICSLLSWILTVIFILLVIVQIDIDKVIWRKK